MCSCLGGGRARFVERDTKLNTIDCTGSTRRAHARPQAKHSALLALPEARHQCVDVHVHVQCLSRSNLDFDHEHEHVRQHIDDVLCMACMDSVHKHAGRVCLAGFKMTETHLARNRLATFSTSRAMPPQVCTAPCSLCALSACPQWCRCAKADMFLCEEPV